MQDNKIVFIQILIDIIIMFLFMIYIYVLVYPGYSGIILNFWGNDSSFAVKLKEIFFIGFYWVDSVFLLVSLIFIFKVGFETKKGNLYSKKVIKCNNISCVLLLVSMLYLLIGNFVFFILGYNFVYFIDLFILFICAIIVSVLLLFSCAIKTVLINDGGGVDES